MGSVTVLDATRMLEIEGASVVSGSVNGSGHLILTTHDGTVIDAGYVWGTVVAATTSQAGIAELATSAETDALSDATRVVTPAGIANTVNGITTRLTTIETTPGVKVQTIALPVESAIPTSYPLGVSITVPSTGSGWSLGSGFGTVVTIRAASPDRCVQTFYDNNGGTNHPHMWYRTWHATDGGGGWTAWETVARIRDLPVVPAMVLGTSTITVTPADGAGKNVSVTFPAGSFSGTGIPNVHANFSSGAGATSNWHVRAIAPISNTGFQIFLFGPTLGSGISYSVDVQYTAIKK